MTRPFLTAAALLLVAVLGWQALRRLPARPGKGPSVQDLAKLRALSQILLSRNDNDPRLDRDFNDLSPAAKELFRRLYRELPPERRNERGTVVYLLGRNLSSAEDWEFLASVAGEPPCLSLSDCSKAWPGDAEHGGDEVTLAYPSLVALKSAEAALASGAPKSRAKTVILAGRKSGMPAVVRLAGRLEAGLSAGR
ncbi:MAG: hypothetical protein HY924_09645 [Elusimicrobia bacterium]|nr:hypothetical protein [Elusimicrobiota bacterium]